jgi:predicted transcriptional regulator
MKAILITIQSEYASMIYAGRKTIVLREQNPNVPIGTPCLIYEPRPIGRVTGYFTYAGSFNFDTLCTEQSLLKKAGMTYSKMRAYYANQLIGVAWQIEKPTPFPDALSLDDLNVWLPPHSYKFIDIPDGVL